MIHTNRYKGIFYSNYKDIESASGYIGKTCKIMLPLFKPWFLISRESELTQKFSSVKKTYNYTAGFMKTYPSVYTLFMNTIYLSQSTHLAEGPETHVICFRCLHWRMEGVWSSGQPHSSSEPKLGEGVKKC